MLDQALWQTSNPRTVKFSVTAFPAWLQILSKGQVIFPESCKFAVSSTTSSDAINTVLTSGAGSGKTQLQAAMACPAAIAFLMDEHNDRSSSFTLATTIANFTTLISGLVGSGKIVIIVIDPPSGTAADTAHRFTGAQLAYHVGFRDWVIRKAPSLWPGRVYGVDTWPVMEDTATSAAGGDVLASKTQDNVHPNALGGYGIATQILPILQSLGLPRLDVAIHAPGETYDSANNATGNLLGSAGTIYGATGSMPANAGGVTYAGNKPSGSSISTNSAAQAGTLTITGAMVSTSTGNWFQLTVAGTTASNSNPQISLINTLTLGNLTAGDVLQTFGEFEIDANGTGLVCAAQQLTRTLPSSSDTISLLYDLPSVSGKLDSILSTLSAPLAGYWCGDLTTTVDGTETLVQLQHQIMIQPSSTINFVVRMRKSAVRKVI
jgi:hypothetical protein